MRQSVRSFSNGRSGRAEQQKTERTTTTTQKQRIYDRDAVLVGTHTDTRQRTVRTITPVLLKTIKLAGNEWSGLRPNLTRD